MQGQQSVTGAGGRQPGGGRPRGRLGGGAVPPQPHHDAACRALRRAAARGGAPLRAAHLRGAASIRAAGALTTLDGSSIWTATCSRSARALCGRPPWSSLRRRRLLGPSSASPHMASSADLGRCSCQMGAAVPKAEALLPPPPPPPLLGSGQLLRAASGSAASMRNTALCTHQEQHGPQTRRRGSTWGDTCRVAARDVRRTRDSVCRGALARAAHQPGPHGSIPIHRSFRTGAVCVLVASLGAPLHGRHSPDCRHCSLCFAACMPRHATSTDPHDPMAAPQVS